MIRVYQDCFSEDIVQLIEDICTCTSFTWKSSNRILSSVNHDSNLDNALRKDSRIVDSIQLVHDILNGQIIISPIFHVVAILINQFISFLNNNDPLFCKELFGDDLRVNLTRVKANLIPKQRFNQNIKFNPPHLDPNKSDSRQLIVIYYINDSDGDIFFFDDNLKITKRVSPKKGSIVIFDGNILHASSPPQDYRSRMVINININLPS